MIFKLLTTASTAIAATWQPNAHSLTSSAGFMTLAAVALAAVVIALLAKSAWSGSALQAARLPARTSALWRKSRGAVFQRQLNPDAAGHARPRAPSARPAAA